MTFSAVNEQYGIQPRPKTGKHISESGPTIPSYLRPPGEGASLLASIDRKGSFFAEKRQIKKDLTRELVL